MRFLHAMVRVRDIDAAVSFFGLLGLREVRRTISEAGRHTLVWLSTGHPDDTTRIELTYNWDEKKAYTQGRNFGHLAYEVEDIYAVCARLHDGGVTIARPPRDGKMAFVRSPDGISIELLQKGAALPPEEPWASMKNKGTW
jgi:lactoylglutathione lyase